MKHYQFLTQVGYLGKIFLAGSIHVLNDIDAKNLASEIRFVHEDKPERIRIIPVAEEKKETPLPRIDPVEKPTEKAIESAPNKMQKKRKKK